MGGGRHRRYGRQETQERWEVGYERERREIERGQRERGEIEREE